MTKMVSISYDNKHFLGNRQNLYLSAEFKDEMNVQCTFYAELTVRKEGLKVIHKHLS